MTAAAAHFVAGCLHERTGAADEAVASFNAGIAVAESRDRRLGVGTQWVKCDCGVARVLARRGARIEAEKSLESVREMFRDRSRFVWGWILNASYANVHYEVASAPATLGRNDAAVEELREAARLGWANGQQLVHDPAFEELKERADVRQLIVRAGESVTLAPPVGSGGLP